MQGQTSLEKAFDVSEAKDAEIKNPCMATN
jgi:hypothetical protein